MFRTLKLITLVLVVCSALQAQRVIPAFSAFKSTTLSSSAEKVTVQQPATNGRPTFYEGATAYCENACIITLSINGTAASSTSLTPVALKTGETVTNTAWHTSNAGSGTTVATYQVAAGSTIVIDLSSIYMEGSVTTRNLSIGTNTISGKVEILIVWRQG